VWTSCFQLLFLVVLVSLIWMHVAIRLMERRKYPELAEEKYLSDVPERPVTASDEAQQQRRGGYAPAS